MPPSLKPIKLFFFLTIVCCTILGSSLGHAQTLRDLYETAVAAYSNGQYDTAIDTYKEIIKQAPQFAPAYIGIGLAIKDKGGDIEEVLYYYKTAVDKDPTNTQALEQLGRLYYAMGRSEKAQPIFEKIVSLNPSMTDVKMSLAWIHLMGRKINPERAVFYFQDVIKTQPSPNAYFGLGMAYFADNQRTKAMDMITQLKTMGQEDLADKLEKALRENRKIVLDQFNNASIDEEGGDNPAAPSNENQGEFEKTGEGSKGFKVRLRGKLDQF